MKSMFSKKENKSLGLYKAFLGILFFGLSLSCSSTVDKSKAPSVEKNCLGQINNTDIYEYTLTNSNNMEVKVLTYGATITNIIAPDNQGNLQSVVLGFDTLSFYAGWQNSLMGSTVGRVANRIDNKKFTLDGNEYTLTSNIHGGKIGFDKRIWTGKEMVNDTLAAVEMSYLSEDGEEGFPGNLNVSVTFSLTNSNDVVLTYKATTDKATPVVLTNHSYFNLSGKKGTKTLNTELTIFADKYLEAVGDNMLNGNILPVENTPFDFRTSKSIGEQIEEEAVSRFNGYDLTYVLRQHSGNLALAARAYEPASGRIMEVLTTEPGVVFYTGNWLNEKVIGRNGIPYTKNGAFCLETQHFPNSVNIPDFPNTILQPGETFNSTTIYRFLVKK